MQVERPEEIADLIRRALKHIEPERLILTSDCGFGRQSTSRMHATYKMIALVRGANIVRKELGLPEAYIPGADAKLSMVPLAKGLIGSRTLDPRITPARPDLAAAHLRGKVEAARFVEGTEQEVIVGIAPLRQEPSHDAPLLTEALCGERVTVYETDEEGWAWGQLKSDGYVGWLPAAALLAPGPAPTHKVDGAAHPGVPRAFDQAAADRCAAARRAASPWCGSRRASPSPRPAASCRSAISRRSRTVEPDFVAVAERFLGVPYLWGGKSSLGIDCSGLVQVALTACGIKCPRDSDMQESALGKSASLAGLQQRRPDLLERPRRHRARPQQHDPRQRVPHGGGDRTRGRSVWRASAPPAARSPACGG